MSERRLFALRFAHEREGQWFEAHALASHELREAMRSGDEERYRMLRHKRGSVGWGLTLSSLAREGLVDRTLNGFVWSYRITEAGKAAA